MLPRRTLKPREGADWKAADQDAVDVDAADEAGDEKAEVPVMLQALRAAEKDAPAGPEADTFSLQTKVIRNRSRPPRRQEGARPEREDRGKIMLAIENHSC